MGRIKAGRREHFLFYPAGSKSRHFVKAATMKKKLECILLIDDDEPTNYYNSLIIEEIGCADQVRIAQSGKKALEYLANSARATKQGESCPAPDLIFLDINMPAMNGWEFLERYRKLKNHETRPVMVMLTTSLFPEDVLKAKEAPEISCFESKPLTPETLYKIVDRYFVCDQAG
jgi:CheY-like chemotaxis protein